jgi:LPPG:FO 2-phospho-L-lactate transferase
MIVVLSGGNGGGRFCRGLLRAIDAREVTIIGNTGDDIEIYGVRVCPDLDLITFMLAGVLDQERGYGIEGDTRLAMQEFAALGTDTWFDLGDRDLALCLARTRMLKRGDPLHEVTARIADRFDIAARLLPMTDTFSWTAMDTDAGTMHFQEYWVRYRAEVPVRGVGWVGLDSARPAPGIAEALETAEAILLAPSNPVVSIGPILAVPEMRQLLKSSPAPKVAVSPIVGGAVIRGMADRLMPAVGIEVSALGVAKHYADLIDAIVIDEQDSGARGSIEDLGLEVTVTDTIMRDDPAATSLAQAALDTARRVR